jgi:hypothetical protein
MSCTTTSSNLETDTFESSIGDFSIDLEELSGVLLDDSPRKTSSESVSSISFGASYASMFETSCPSLCHSRWESSASEGESNKTNTRLGAGRVHNNKLPSVIDRASTRQPKLASMRIRRSKNCTNALTRASSVTSLSGESLECGNDPSKPSALSSSFTSLLSSTWDSAGEERSCATTVVTLVSEKNNTFSQRREASRRHSVGDISILPNGGRDILMKPCQQQQSPLPPAPQVMCRTTCNIDEIKQQDDRPPALRNSSHLPPRLPSRSISRRELSLQ